MEKIIFLIVLTIASLWMALPLPVSGQVTSGGVTLADPLRVNPGGLAGRDFGLWQPWGWIRIPGKLPVPGNAEWVKKLKAARVSEIKALAQFEADLDKFPAFMPYAMVIPQTDQHIRWIEELFKAYGLVLDEEIYLVGPAASQSVAYEKSKMLESELVALYEWLVKNAEDRDSVRVIDTILIRSRFHAILFEHVLRMGQGYAFSMRGIIGLDYGYSFGEGPIAITFGSKPFKERFATAREAEYLVRNYLKSSKNPNLRVGKVHDAGESFEVEVVTMKDSLVDKVLVNKATGWMRSAYK